MKEAANAEKFAENFTNMEYVKVPKIYWEYTTPQVQYLVPTDFSELLKFKSFSFCQLNNILFDCRYSQWNMSQE